MENNNLDKAIIGIGLMLSVKMEQKGILSRVKEAQDEGVSKDDILHIVKESEPVVFEVLGEITKNDEDLEEKEIMEKRKFFLTILNHNYKYFGYKEPYIAEGTDDVIIDQFEQAKMRNGIATPINESEIENEAEEIFLYDSHDKENK